MTMDVSHHSVRRNTLDLSMSSHASTCIESGLDDCPPPVKHVYTTIPTMGYLNKDDSDLERSQSSHFGPSIEKQSLEQGSTSRMSALMIMRRGSLNGSVSTAASGSEENLRNVTDFPDISLGSLDYTAIRRKSSSLSHRDALLEQTKIKSWSNLSGYDSCGPTYSRKERYGRNANWISSSMSTRSNPDRANANEYLHSLFTDRGSLLKQKKSIQQQKQDLLSKDSPLEQYAQYARRNKRHFENHLDLLNRNVCHTNPLNDSAVTLVPDLKELSSSRSAVDNKPVLQNPALRKSRVSFSTVEVRHYERILGDNPGVSSGPPLSIGWNYYEDRTLRVSVDEYEYYHNPCQDESDMVLSRYERESILEGLGYSEKDVARSIRQNYKMKRNRRQTVNNLPVMAIEEAVETAKKSLSKILPGRKTRSSKILYKEWMKSRCENMDETASHTSARSGVKSILKSASSLCSLSSSKDENPQESHVLVSSEKSQSQISISPGMDLDSKC